MATVQTKSTSTQSAIARPRRRRFAIFQIAQNIPRPLYFFIVALSFAIPIGVWCYYSYTGKVDSYILPTPTAVYQAMLPLLRGSSDARIVNVSSGVGSLTVNADPTFPYHAMFGPIYPASKTALNAITLATMIELESTDIKVNLVSPAFTKTNLNGYEGTESVEDGSREVVRVALLGPGGPTGTFTRWESTSIPW